jgi:hypothetical protein
MYHKAIFKYIEIQKFPPKTVKFFNINFICNIPVGVNGKGNGKTIPVEAFSGPEGSRRLRLPDFMTVDTRRS